MMRSQLRFIVESCLLLALVFTTLIALLKLLATGRSERPVETYLPAGGPEGALTGIAWSRRPAFLPSTHRPSTHS